MVLHQVSFLSFVCHFIYAIIGIIQTQLVRECGAIAAHEAALAPTPLAAISSSQRYSQSVGLSVDVHELEHSVQRFFLLAELFGFVSLGLGLSSLSSIPEPSIFSTNAVVVIR